MKKKYIRPKIKSNEMEESDNILSGSVTATAPDMEGEMNCPCGGDESKCTCFHKYGYCDCWGCGGFDAKKGVFLNYD